MINFFKSSETQKTQRKLYPWQKFESLKFPKVTINYVHYYLFLAYSGALSLISQNDPRKSLPKIDSQISEAEAEIELYLYFRSLDFFLLISETTACETVWLFKSFGILVEITYSSSQLRDPSGEMARFRYVLAACLANKDQCRFSWNSKTPENDRFFQKS